MLAATTPSESPMEFMRLTLDRGFQCAGTTNFGERLCSFSATEVASCGDLSHRCAGIGRGISGAVLT